MNFLLTYILIVGSFVASLLLFDFIIYLKILITECSKTRNFVVSKYKNISKIKTTVFFDYIFLAIGAVASIGFGISLLLYFFANTIYGYLLIVFLLIACIMALCAKVSGIESITCPGIHFGKFFFSLNPPFGLKGSIIIWKDYSLSTKFYRLLIVFIKYSIILSILIIVIKLMWFVFYSFKT